MLKSITRDGSSPQGKARVYFCCHPEDFERYFKPITEEIFQYHNCAIYYEADPDVPYDAQELFSDHSLGRMQLFVMPVTAKLLYQKSRAIDVEFPFALKEHIPVLPLMQEPNLERVFNEKCGELQFLDKNKQDNTSIKYEEKLEKFLSDVLIGDELAAKIRDAFDAYVFLSYRKKDRKYAQELMRLIHKNDFCRDIAIWYDEFLNPGENFNGAIEEALKKSKLFALAVTPNLINEENYIMTKEYPLAKKAGKKIMPAEMEKTDGKLLEEKYDGIPHCINAYNEPELSKELLDAFKDIAIRKNDTDPEHNFFIGLAYLDGVDVERDNERALGLITSSANADLPEAMEKLVTTYQTGKGAETNYKAAIEWQKRLVEYYKKAFAKEGNEKSEKEYAHSILTLGFHYHELNMLPEAIKACLSTIEIYKRLSKKNPEAYEQ
ncbi:toll/interleukin-1 receptor domain-containing protein, partial [Candidatus Nomurabacteria bacterium]|nr:toll/interleukin-1 receptor domain-containing protein [Candidatus Nomurabacteria bacterium]